jgi:hypothetical protein
MNKAFLKIFAKVFSLGNSRYVNRFVPVEEDLVPGKNELADEKDKEAFSNLKKAVENIEKIVNVYPAIKELDEILFVYVKDLGNLRFCVTVRDGKGDIKVGWPENTKPSFTLPLYSVNLKNLVEVTRDGEISMQDAYRFTRALFIPFLHGLYRGDYTNLPEDKSYLKLDNFIQVEVKNEFGIEVDGFPGPARATVVNVDGQWLIFEGFHGDPDIRYVMSLKEALEFAYILRVKLVKEGKTKSFMELKPVIDNYNELKEKVKDYERSWHNI